MGKQKKKDYEQHLERLQLELGGLTHWLQHTGKRMLVLFEGRDTAGKGGAIHAIAERLNPRQVRIVALAKPSQREQTQWYFQRYVPFLPAAGELVLMDRSWYNRAGVEHVMGWCSKAQYRQFLKQVPVFERMLVDDGILLYKYWLAVDQKYQEERFAERAKDPLKRWKLSPIDLEARRRYAEYGAARDTAIRKSHTKRAPWFVVDFNDQRRGRLNLIRHLLDHVPDRKVPETPLTLPPLRGKLQKEHYPRSIAPVRGKY